MSNSFKPLTLQVWRGEKEEKNGGGGAVYVGWEASGEGVEGHNMDSWRSRNRENRVKNIK